MENHLPPRPIWTSGENTFASDTMVRRLPTNIRNVADAHPAYSTDIKKALYDLADTIAGNEVIPPPPLPAWDYEHWFEAYRPHQGERWHETEWFFGETYGFRLVLDAARYFETLVDPYGPMKRAELDSEAPFLPIKRFLESPSDGITRLEEALHISMWGNRADISFTAGGALDHSAGDSRLLLRDDTTEAVTALTTSLGTVHIVMDNSGAELAGDLVLAAAIGDVLGRAVVLHPKFYPTYVSDTTVADIHEFLQTGASFSDPLVRQFVHDVDGRIANGSIRIAPDDYWCGVRFLCDMPNRLHRTFRRAGVVIVKGDFNYRRVFRDTIWESGTDPMDAMGFYPSFPVLLLRTMKSDCLVGIDRSIMDELDTSEPGWRTKGKRGVIQLVGKRVS